MRNMYLYNTHILTFISYITENTPCLDYKNNLVPTVQTIFSWAYFDNYTKYMCTRGDRAGTVVKVMYFKSEGRWFHSSWCHWNSSLS